MRLWPFSALVEMYSTNVPRFFVSIFSRRTGTNNMQISVLLDFSHTGELILFARNVFTFVVIDADMFFQNICDFFCTMILFVYVWSFAQ